MYQILNYLLYLISTKITSKKNKIEVKNKISDHKNYSRKIKLQHSKIWKWKFCFQWRIMLLQAKKYLPWKEMISGYTRNIDMQHIPLKYSIDHIIHIPDFYSNVIYCLLELFPFTVSLSWKVLELFPLHGKLNENIFFSIILCKL